MKKNNIKSKTLRIAVALTTIASCVSATYAQKTSGNVAEQESSGFNALNHVLQKPLGNPSFPEDKRGFARNLYFGFNAGGSFINNNLTGDIKPGINVGAHFGGWFTPVHGMRFTATGGKHSIHKWVDDAWYGSLRVDYMSNLSALLYGYDPNRKFELIGATGLMLQYVQQDGSKGCNYGFATSLQMRFNTSRSFYLFIEPEVSVLGGKRYDTYHSWYKIYTDLGINVGLGYRILNGKARLEGATKFEQKRADNLYYALGGGVFMFPGSNLNSDNPRVTITGGKMLSSASGIQATASFGKTEHGVSAENRYAAVGTLDYVLNLNHALTGYRPNSVFQMLLNVGVNAGIVQRSNKLHPGLQAGITGLFRLSRNWGIYIHPQIFGFTESFTDALGADHHPMVAVDLGVRYTIGDFTRLYKETTGQFYTSDEIKKWFVGIGGGAGVRARGGRPNMYDGFVHIGRQFSPMSTWRINIDGEKYPHLKTATLGVEYLTSIGTAMYGYKPNRVFDVQTVTGLYGGASKYDGGSATAVFGANAGVQANFSVSRSFDIFLSPQVVAAYTPHSATGKYWTPDLRLHLGVQYKFGN